MQQHNFKDVLIQLQEQTQKSIDPDTVEVQSLIDKRIQDIQLAIKETQERCYENMLLLTKQEYFENQFDKIPNELKQQSIQLIDLVNDIQLAKYCCDLPQEDGADEPENIILRWNSNLNLNPNFSIENIVINKNNNNQRIYKNNSKLRILQRQSHNHIQSTTTKNNHQPQSVRYQSSQTNIFDMSTLQSMDSKINRSVSLSRTDTENQNKLPKWDNSIRCRSKNDNHSAHQINDEQVKNLIQLLKQPRKLQEKGDKAQKIKELLARHRQEGLERRKKVQKDLERSKQKNQEKIQKEKKERQAIMKKYVEKGIQQTLLYKERRQNNLADHNAHLEQTQMFLERISKMSKHQRKRIHQILKEKYNQQVIRQDSKRNQRLRKIRDERKPFQDKQFESHLQKYLEYKQTLDEQRKAKKLEFKYQSHQIEQGLRSLFHSRRYKQISQNKSFLNPHKSMIKELKDRKVKIKQFSQSVDENYKPEVDPQKRNSLEERVQHLLLSEDKSKRKISKNSKITFQDKIDIDEKKIGVGYLNYLKTYLQGKPRKQKAVSQSLSQLKPDKKINYLRENKNQPLKTNSSRPKWKKVISDRSFNAKGKYEVVRNSINTLQHQALNKEAEAKNLKNTFLEFEKKEQFDKLYKESVQAKIAILNDLMLKT